MPARCTARRKIPFRMSWSSVSCGARAEQRMVRLRRCRRPVWTSPLLSSRERENDQPSQSRTEGAAKEVYEGAIAAVLAWYIY
jgi:hypothetical protein